jgi:bifunctional autolysin
MKIKVKFGILLLFGIFMVSGVVCNTALAQIPSVTGIGVKIDTPVDSTNLPAGDLTIYGTSSDDDTTNCQVYADWNDLKPMQNVSANGPKGISDFSKWSFTYTSNYHNIVEGQNELTSKITCYDSGPNASSKSYSINVTGTQGMNKNSNDTLQQTKGDTVPESSNILSVKSNNNDNNDLNDAAQQSNQENISNTDTESTNVDTDTESTNVDTDTESTNVDTNAESTNVDTDAKATNVDTDAKATNVDTDAKATNVDPDANATNVDTDAEATNILPLKSNNTNSTPQQTNEDTDNEANNILPVQNNKSNSGTYKILPLYSESNEKSTKSDSSEGSDGTNLGSSGTVESEDGYNSKTIDTTDTGTSTTLGSQQEGQTEANTSPLSGSEISEGTDQSGVDSNTNTYFTYEPDLGEDQGSSNNYDHTTNTPGSDNSVSNLNDEGNSIFGLKFNHLHKSIDTKLEKKIEKLEDKIADRVHLFDLIG